MTCNQLWGGTSCCRHCCGKLHAWSTPSRPAPLTRGSCWWVCRLVSDCTRRQVKQRSLSQRDLMFSQVGPQKTQINASWPQSLRFSMRSNFRTLVTCTNLQIRNTAQNNHQPAPLSILWVACKHTSHCLGKGILRQGPVKTGQVLIQMRSFHPNHFSAKKTKQNYG